MTARAWTEDELQTLALLYPDYTNRIIAKTMGRTIRSVKMKASSLGLSKNPDIESTGQNTGRFQKGSKPWNAGLKGVYMGNSATRFQKGHKPHTWHPIGTERVTDDGYLQRKLTDTGVTRRDFVPVHHIVWKEAGHEIPPGHNLVFKDGNRRNFDLDNLELVSRAENMRRNSLHRYPKEIALAIQLRGALNRRINNAAKRQEKDQ